MSLDHFGQIAAAEIAFYAPLLLIAFFVTLKHGFGRQEGWVFLFMFCSIRIVGAALTVASKTSSTVQIGLIVTAAVMSSIGLSPLLLATLGFIKKIAQHDIPQRPLRLTKLVLVVALILGAIGGSKVAPGNSPSSVASGRTLTRVSIILFMAAFVVLFALHVMLWGTRGNLQTHHHNLLTGVSLALPPLFVRLVYALLGAFASSIQSRWSPIFGDWWIYLTMGLVMEFLAAVTYVVTGILIPAPQNDEKEARAESDEVHRMDRMALAIGV